jgi:hypothetical protein
MSRGAKWPYGADMTPTTCGRMDALATAFDTWLDDSVTVTLANGDTETKTRRQYITRFYGPYMG